MQNITSAMQKELYTGCKVEPSWGASTETDPRIRGGAVVRMGPWTRAWMKLSNKCCLLSCLWMDIKREDYGALLHRECGKKRLVGILDTLHIHAQGCGLWLQSERREDKKAIVPLFSAFVGNLIVRNDGQQPPVNLRRVGVLHSHHESRRTYLGTRW